MLGAEAEGDSVVVRFAPSSNRPEIVDRIPLGPWGDPAAVHGVGRILRILRTGRVKLPTRPYHLEADAERVAALLRRCRGITVTLRVMRRLERQLTVWTEAGVDHFRGVVDFEEDREGLWIRRRGGGHLLRIPRRSLIRFTSTSLETSQVVGVELPTRTPLY